MQGLLLIYYFEHKIFKININKFFVVFYWPDSLVKIKALLQMLGLVVRKTLFIVLLQQQNILNKYIFTLLWCFTA